MAMARQAADDAAFLRRAKAFVRLLRNQAGIPVRQPAHAVAPFRAEPIMFGCHVQLTKSATSDLTYDLPVLFSPQLVYRLVSGTATVSSQEDATRGPSDSYYLLDNTGNPPPIEVLPVTDSSVPPFTTPGIDPFPDGFLGFLTGIEVTTFRGDNVLDHLVVKDLRYSVLIDGQAVSGFSGAYPRVDLGQNEPGASGYLLPNGWLPRGGSVATQLGAPIQVRPGQRVTIRLRAPQSVASASIIECRVQVFGYKIPTKSGGDRTIYDTLTD